MKRIPIILLWGWMFLASPNLVNAEEVHFKSVLNNFIAIALENNPGVLELQNRIKAAQEVPSQVSSLADPILQIGLMNMPVDTFEFNQEPVTQKTISVSQAFPFPGKLELRSEIAEKDIMASELDLEEVKLSLVKGVKKAFYELCFILAAIDITKENKKLLETFVSIAETKYSVGKGIQQDVLKAQVELTKILDQLIVLEKFAGIEKARLNTLMNYLPQKPLTIPHGITKTDFSFSVEQLQALADSNRPILSKINVLRDKYETAKKLAEKDYYPNFNVGFKYGQRQDSRLADRPDFVSAYVGINIPLWFETKQSKKVSEAGYKVEMTKETFNKEKNQIYFNLNAFIEKEAQSSKTIQLIQQGILPQARQSLESALAGYSVDKVDFLTLLSNQVTLFQWEVKYHRELTEYEKTLAEIESVVGKRLF
ncbi:MAG: TolC family protein [Nitrospina sp.]|nr:TolC family protein [Nitrospina sp.]MBT5631205.1 TolC family protein [Nitrospina sp.]